MGEQMEDVKFYIMIDGKEVEVKPAIFKPEKTIKEQLAELVHEIREWNEQTFPDATLEGQLMKLEEEFKEVHEARQFWKKEQEFADVFIVASGLTRWGSVLAYTLLNDWLTFQEKDLKRILKNVRKKMDKNRKRTWEKSGDGRYHHKKKEEKKEKEVSPEIKVENRLLDNHFLKEEFLAYAKKHLDEAVINADKKTTISFKLEPSKLENYTKMTTTLEM